MRIIDTPLNELKVVHNDYLYYCSSTRTNQNGDTYKLMACADWRCAARISLKKKLNQSEWKRRYEDISKIHRHSAPDPAWLAEMEHNSVDDSVKVIETASAQFRVLHEGYLYNCSYTSKRANGDTYKRMTCTSRSGCSARISLKRKCNQNEWKVYLVKRPKQHTHLPLDELQLAELERNRIIKERRSSKKTLKKLHLRLQSLNVEQGLFTSIETNLSIIISQLKATRSSLEFQVQKLDIGRHDSLRCVRNNVNKKLSDVSNLYCENSSVLDYAEQIMRNHNHPAPAFIDYNVLAEKSVNCRTSWTQPASGGKARISSQLDDLKPIDKCWPIKFSALKGKLADDETQDTVDLKIIKVATERFRILHEGYLFALCNTRSTKDGCVSNQFRCLKKDTHCKAGFSIKKKPSDTQWTSTLGPTRLEHNHPLPGDITLFQDDQDGGNTGEPVANVREVKPLGYVISEEVAKMKIHSKSGRLHVLHGDYAFHMNRTIHSLNGDLLHQFRCVKIREGCTGYFTLKKRLGETKWHLNVKEKRFEHNHPPDRAYFDLFTKLPIFTGIVIETGVTGLDNETELLEENQDIATPDLPERSVEVLCESLSQNKIDESLGAHEVSEVTEIKSCQDGGIHGEKPALVVEVEVTSLEHAIKEEFAKMNIYESRPGRLHILHDSYAFGSKGTRRSTNGDILRRFHCVSSRRGCTAYFTFKQKHGETKWHPSVKEDKLKHNHVPAKHYGDVFAKFNICTLRLIDTPSTDSSLEHEQEQLEKTDDITTRDLREQVDFKSGEGNSSLNVMDKSHAERKSSAVRVALTERVTEVRSQLGHLNAQLEVVSTREVELKQLIESLNSTKVTLDLSVSGCDDDSARALEDCNYVTMMEMLQQRSYLLQDTEQYLRHQQVFLLNSRSFLFRDAATQTLI
ncbi:hypothetical protein HDE_13217 [Halotydeus destructor]|nr:hypothetical protein HDE_13217 [Halotydeus destructor]